ncbi:zinc ABC transporter permease subunit ZnuB [Alginatibacterium sediminis]|uniref:High-affinity zinc uptake system membrane protein ZnuB n=1 Tax=Alginatibacterium sediminis TaxID=2164068 RepID=A0A420EMX9_9ALTE|nr:zinc ABC transporter permease subunit ZnuB [Alginatibacterium sediminis]RKF22077.1 zinc ABC transporter permease subunit ZnuB [Alginatibacterium sediminis]
MIDGFLVHALLAGLGIAILAGPLGSFVVWRKLAYFGDTLAHSSLLGLAIGLWLQINLTAAVVMSGAILALVLVSLQKQKHLASDTLLGILAHSALSLGLVAVALMDNVRVDLMAYLFGDLLAVGITDLIWIWGGGAVVIAILVWKWRDLLSATVNEEIAAVEGVNVALMRAIILLLLALVIGVAMKFVGALIISSLLLIPAASARKFSRSPEQMAGLAILFGASAVCLGLSLSWFKDTPAGPSVVVMAALQFVFVQVLPVSKRT